MNGVRALDLGSSTGVHPVDIGSVTDPKVEREVVSVDIRERHKTTRQCFSNIFAYFGQESSEKCLQRQFT